jgi:hypothetical protein
MSRQFLQVLCFLHSKGPVVLCERWLTLGHQKLTRWSPQTVIHRKQSRHIKRNHFKHRHIILQHFLAAKFVNIETRQQLRRQHKQNYTQEDKLSKKEWRKNSNNRTFQDLGHPEYTVLLFRLDTIKMVLNVTSSFTRRKWTDAQNRLCSILAPSMSFVFSSKILHT